MTGHQRQLDALGPPTPKAPNQNRSVAIEPFDQPRIILQFQDETQPRTLQALSRESTAWVEQLTNLASIQGCNPLLPIIGAPRDLPTFTLLAEPDLIAAVLAIVAQSHKPADDAHLRGWSI